MPIMNLLVAFNGSVASEAALRYAASFAKNRNAHVTAFVAHSTHEVIDSKSRWIPKEARALLMAANENVVGTIKDRFDALARELDLGDQLSFRLQAGRVDTTLAEAARSFDMIIVGQYLEGDDEHVSVHPDRIALLSGRPVIVVPAGYDAQAEHAHAAIAWDGSRAAARALSDSLRLLEYQGKVSVLTIGTPQGLPVEDLMTHFERHDVAAELETWPEGHPIASTILGYCERRDPSLLVMGAYEHSKFREDFLGGMTASVLRDIKIPVLLSH